MDSKKFRPLALQGGGVGHSFRQNLPVNFVQIARDEYDSDITAKRKEKGLGDDASLFLLSFLAFFTAFYTFIF